MPDIDTKIGGDRESFPETIWSSILNCPDPESPERRAKLNQLFSLYWKPVYKLIRATRRKTVEDAKDLTQAFFCHVLEGDLVSRYQAEKGKFRFFLRGALKTFLLRTHRDAGRLKRGGTKTIVSLNTQNMDADDVLPDPNQQTPDEVFDQQWARQVLSTSLTDLRGQLIEEGKESYFQVYEKLALEPAGGKAPTYEVVAEQVGISVHDVDNYLRQVRTRLQQTISKNISDYVTSREELIEEMKDLYFG